MRRKLARSFGVEAEVITGEWNGPVTSAFQTRARTELHLLAPFGHDWLEIKLDAETFEIDPTYLQFTGDTEWTMDGALQSVQYCVK